MFGRTVTVTIAELNAGEEKKEVMIAATESGGTGKDRNVEYYPQELQIYNNSGTDVEYIILDSPDDEILFDNSDTKFAYILIPNGKDISRKISKCYKIVIKKVSGGTATADLRMDFINMKKEYVR